jgi:hypothetical protein
MKITKTNDERIGLSLNQEQRNQEEDVKTKVKNIKVCNTKVQIHFYYDKTKGINTKITK